MFTETRETIIERMERMRNRYLHSGLDIDAPYQDAVAAMAGCISVGDCLHVEALLTKTCDELYPVETGLVDALLVINGFAFSHRDAKQYRSKTTV